MHNVSTSFKILEDNDFFLLNYKKVTGYILFNVKIDFNHKSHWLLDVHTTLVLVESVIAYELSRKSVRISLTYDSFHCA